MRWFTPILLLAAVAGPGLALSPQQACMADYRKFCAEIRPGGGRVKACLIEHRAELSSDCKKVLQTAKPKAAH